MDIVFIPFYFLLYCVMAHPIMTIVSLFGLGVLSVFVGAEYNQERY